MKGPVSAPALGCSTKKYSGAIDKLLSHGICKNLSRRLSRCYLTGTILKAAAPSLYPDGRPTKANTGEHWWQLGIFLLYFNFYHLISGVWTGAGLRHGKCALWGWIAASPVHKPYCKCRGTGAKVQLVLYHVVYGCAFTVLSVPGVCYLRTKDLWAGNQVDPTLDFPGNLNCGL